MMWVKFEAQYQNCTIKSNDNKVVLKNLVHFKIFNIIPILNLPTIERGLITVFLFCFVLFFDSGYSIPSIKLISCLF